MKKGKLKNLPERGGVQRSVCKTSHETSYQFTLGDILKPRQVHREGRSQETVPLRPIEFMKYEL